MPALSVGFALMEYILAFHPYAFPCVMTSGALLVHEASVGVPCSAGQAPSSLASSSMGPDPVWRFPHRLLLVLPLTSHYCFQAEATEVI